MLSHNKQKVSKLMGGSTNETEFFWWGSWPQSEHLKVTNFRMQKTCPPHPVAPPYSHFLLFSTLTIPTVSPFHEDLCAISFRNAGSVFSFFFFHPAHKQQKWQETPLIDAATTEDNRKRHSNASLAHTLHHQFCDRQVVFRFVVGSKSRAGPVHLEDVRLAVLPNNPVYREDVERRTAKHHRCRLSPLSVLRGDVDWIQYRRTRIRLPLPRNGCALERPETIPDFLNAYVPNAVDEGLCRTVPVLRHRHHAPHIVHIVVVLDAELPVPCMGGAELHNRGEGAAVEEPPLRWEEVLGNEGEVILPPAETSRPHFIKGTLDDRLVAEQENGAQRVDGRYVGVDQTQQLIAVVLAGSHHFIANEYKIWAEVDGAALYRLAVYPLPRHRHRKVLHCGGEESGWAAGCSCWLRLLLFLVAAFTCGWQRLFRGIIP